MLYFVLSSIRNDDGYESTVSLYPILKQCDFCYSEDYCSSTINIHTNFWGNLIVSLVSGKSQFEKEPSESGRKRTGCEDVGISILPKQRLTHDPHRKEKNNH